jgi:hypothetical protein
MQQAPGHCADIVEELQGGTCVSAMDGAGDTEETEAPATSCSSTNDPVVVMERTESESRAGTEKGYGHGHGLGHSPGSGIGRGRGRGFKSDFFFSSPRFPRYLDPPGAS